MSVVGDAFNGVGLWITRKERKSDRDDAAVRSVLIAINATKTYLARRERGEAIDREAEGKLAELWTSAAVNIRRSDMDLATRLEEKADYWTNPDNWTNGEVRASRIQIDEIANEGQRLLRSI